MSQAAAPNLLWQPQAQRHPFKTWAIRIATVALLLVCTHATLHEQNWQAFTAEGTIAFNGDRWLVPSAFAVAWDLIARSFPPDWSYANALLRPVWETIVIATVGTVLAMGLSIPLALLAAKPTSPHPIARAVALFLIVASRSITSLIWGLLFVMVIGPGTTAGVLAIGIRSVGFLSKLLYETIEEMDLDPVLAVRCTGAGRGQVFVYGLVPQLQPTFASLGLFRWDINIRESAIIGFVGAGGLGLYLKDMANALLWPRVCLILLVILALVVLSETIAAHLRHRLH